MKRLVVQFAVLLVLFASAGSALAGTQAGQTQINGMIMVMKPIEDDDSGVVWSIAASGSRFVTDGLALGGFVNVNGTSGGEEDDLTTFLYGTGEYNFNMGSTAVPFLGGGIGVWIPPSDSEADTETVAMPYGGLKQFLTEDLFLIYQVSYMGLLDEFGDGIVLGTVGLGFLF